jgi:hypothetical protein
LQIISALCSSWQRAVGARAGAAAAASSDPVRLLPPLVSRGIFSAAESGDSDSLVPALLSKRATFESNSSLDELPALAFSCGAEVQCGEGAGAKRSASLKCSPPLADKPLRNSSSPVSVILSKRASDDIDQNVGGCLAFEKRTNDGANAGRRDRRNSD